MTGIQLRAKATIIASTHCKTTGSTERIGESDCGNDGALGIERHWSGTLLLCVTLVRISEPMNPHI